MTATVRPSREAYARGHAERKGHECTVGIEIDADDDVAAMTDVARSLASTGAFCLSMKVAVRTVVEGTESRLRAWFPDRAYFIETEHESAGVQVYQPFGMPRTR